MNENTKVSFDTAKQIVEAIGQLVKSNPDILEERGVVTEDDTNVSVLLEKYRDFVPQKETKYEDNKVAAGSEN